jgi:Zn-dependent peptidase ImmA (M78 family)/transcriptional regulator with XRE-family HTH domain
VTKVTHNPFIGFPPELLGSRLQAVRKARGLTQQQAADHLGIARTTITAIEKGERRIQPLELARLAEYYRRPVAELLRRPAHSGGFSVQLRAQLAPHASVDERLAGLIDEFEQLCEDYVELERINEAPLSRRYPEPYQLGGVQPERAAEDAAGAERNRLGLGDGPVLNLRAVLENDVGTRIFYMDLPSRVAAMFGYTDELGGCVAVNRNHPVERRRLSSAHEYGHFVSRRGRGEVTVLGRYQRVPEHERFADTFAYAFLMPAAGLNRRYNEVVRGRGGKATVADLCQLAHLYYVSVEAMTRRLEELRLVGAGTWDRLQLGGFRVRHAQELLGFPPQPVDDHLLPARYRLMAAEAFQRGALSEGQLARFLRTDRVTARAMMSGLTNRMQVDPEGGVGTLQLDLGLPLDERH